MRTTAIANFDRLLQSSCQVQTLRYSGGLDKLCEDI